MAKATESETVKTVEEVKTPHRVVTGSVLAEHVNTFDPKARARSWQHKRYLKGSTVLLNAKDAKALVGQGVVEPVK